MPRYLFEVRYTAEGVKGLASEGGSARLAASTALIEELGGRLESFHFAFGEIDAYLVAELPDNVSVAAAALAAGGSGAVTTRTVVLLTPEEMDEAARRRANYRPPGG